MRVAHNDAGAKYGEAGETDTTHGVFLHAHDSRIAKPAASCASRGGEQAKLSDSGVVAATRKGTDNADLKPLQFFFAPAPRSRTDTDTAHGADGALTQNFAGKGGRARSKVQSAGVQNDVAHPGSRRKGLSGDHHHFATFRNCQQFCDGGTADLPGTTKHDGCETLSHYQDLCLGKDATARPRPEESIPGLIPKLRQLLPLSFFARNEKRQTFDGLRPSCLTHVRWCEHGAPVRGSVSGRAESTLGGSSDIQPG